MREQGPSQEDINFQADSEPKPEQTSRRSFLKKFGKGIAAAGALAAMPEIVSAHAESAESQEPDEAQLRKDWEEVKEFLKNSTIREDIEYVRDAYGDKGKRLVNQVIFELAAFDKFMEEERSGKDLFADSNKKDLLANLVINYKLYWRFDDAVDSTRKDYREASSRPMPITGFEALDGMDNEKIRQLLESKYDKSWLYGTISSIEYEDSEKSDDVIKIAGSAQNEEQFTTRTGREKVIIYKSNSITDPKERMVLFSHEIGHHHDWRTDRTLGLPERIKLLAEITKRLGAKDRFHSPYVELDVPKRFKNLAPEEIKYKQAIEYWATLVERFDNYPKQLKQIQPADYELVQRWRQLMISRYEKK